MPDAEGILRELLDTIAKEQNYNQHAVNIEAINSGGANYTSALYNITLTAPQKEDLQLFGKVAIIGEKIRELMNGTQLFGTEGTVYTKLAKTYKEIQEKHNIPDEELFKFPKFYGINPNLYEETIVLEDLVARGFGSYNRFISVDWAQAASAVEALAKFHALSFAFQKEKPDEFDKICSAVFSVETPKDDNIKVTWKKMIQKSLAALKEEYREKVSRFLESQGDNAFIKFNQPLGRRVLVHGDYRPSNLLYKREGERVETVPVDYQTVRVACPASDLVYFVFLATDAAFRADHYKQLVAHYYEQLARALHALGLDASELYPSEDFHSDLKKLLPYAVFLGVCILPIVTVEAENAPKVEGDSNFKDLVLPPNELYAERFSGIVRDCIDLGVI